MTSSSFLLLLYALHPYEAVEPHMGTLVRIKLYTTDPDHAKTAFKAAFARIADLDRALSDYRADSELNTLCRSSRKQVSADLFRVLEASQQFADETNGAFDITQGPVIRLWREARRTRQLPDPAALVQASARSGYKHLHLDAATRTATLDLPNMQLDLGGIAKGYAADEALAVLTNLGIESALVAMSGDLAFSHAPPGQRGWKIRLDAFAQDLELAEAAVSTSGDSEQFLDVDSKRYSHIIDPSTGQALTNNATVSVIARRGMDADALATAACVLGRDRALTLRKNHADAEIFVK